jgi:hypothetical protein
MEEACPKGAPNKYIVRQQINMAYMLSIHTFATTNTEISVCMRRRHRELFSVPWFVAWYKENEELVRMKALNSDDMKERIRRFLIDMSDMLLIFGFAGYYCVKDMTRWVESQSPAVYATRLPFGVIPLRASAVGSGSSWLAGNGGPTVGSLYGNYALYTNTRTMEEAVCFDCMDTAINRHYEFHVVTHDARFVSLTDGTSSVAGSYDDYAQGRQWTTGLDVVPVTPFWALYRAKSLIEEARDDQFDANFLLSHPLTIVTAKPVPDAKLDSLSATTIFSANTLSGARQLDNIKKQAIATEAVAMLIDKMNRQANKTKNGERDVRPQELLRNQRRLKYRRPDQTEGMFPIPDFADVTVAHPATVLVDVDALQRQYEHDVCTIVRIPYLFYKNENDQHGGGGGSSQKHNRSSGGSSAMAEEQVSFYRTVLNEEIESERTALSRLFGRVYSRTYMQLDVTGMAAEYVKQHAHETDDEGDLSMAKARILNNMTSTMRVGLTFETTNMPSVNSLSTLLQLFEKGIVSENYVRRHAYNMFGQQEAGEEPPTPQEVEKIRFGGKDLEAKQQAKQQAKKAKKTEKKAKKAKKAEKAEKKISD